MKAETMIEKLMKDYSVAGMSVAVIRDGRSAFFGSVSESWRHPEGWQAVVRTAGDETLAVIHTFGGKFPEKAELPVKARKILRVICSEGNAAALADGKLTVELKAPFEAVAVHLV